jgi:hypothetical protein
MSTPYYKLGDTQLLAFASNVSTRLNGDPSAYFVTLEFAAGYQSAYEGFDVALTAALEPTTRTKPSVAAKNAARAVLIEATKNVAGIVSTNPNCTDEKLETLGFSPRKEPSPRPSITEAPEASVVARYGSAVIVDLRVAGGTGRGRLSIADGAILYTAVSAQEPTDPGALVNQGVTGKTRVQLSFDETLPAGTKVWITAQWINARGTGPASAPISTVIAGGAAIVPPSQMKLAA